MATRAENWRRRPCPPAGNQQTANKQPGHRQRSAAPDERERHLDQREAQLARRERANDLRDLAADRYAVDKDLYPAMDD